MTGAMGAAEAEVEATGAAGELGAGLLAPGALDTGLLATGALAAGMLLAGELGTGEDATTDALEAGTEVVETGATGVLDALEEC